MDRITKDDRCLIKGIQTKKKWGQTPTKRVSEQHYTTSLGYFLLSILVTFVVADGPLTSINQTCSSDISNSVYFTR